MDWEELNAVIEEFFNATVENINALKKILESIFEQDFVDTSYGFRPNRSCHDALKKLNKIIMNGLVNFVVDMDISKFLTQV
ncbi:MAG: hypothetical protein U9Q37_00405 [Euryarchaeota archaeon]|nr:hypothetical protein [Euryarchaeota archaeon]